MSHIFSRVSSLPLRAKVTACVVVGVSLALLGIFIGRNSAASKAREQARDAIECRQSADRLGKLVVQCHRFSDKSENDGKFPKNAMDLYPSYIASPAVFTNPRFPDEEISYFYVPGLSPEDVGCVLLYEAVPKSGLSRNVALSQGAVEWLNDETFKAYMEKTRMKLKQERNIEMVSIPVRPKDLLLK